MLERLPIGACMPLCAYEPVEEDAEFRAALAASRSPLVYASVDYWSDDDAAPMLAGLGPDLDDDWDGPRTRRASRAIAAPARANSGSDR